jgi:outer membrane lipoprotein-sorting protein
MLAASLALMVGQGPSINDLVQPGFQDASFQVKLIFANQGELGKINKDFGQSYKFKNMDVKLKEPFKVRMTGEVEDTSILFVLNGSNRLMSVPKVGYRKRENLDEDPGKRQTPLDFGFMTPSMFQDLFDAKYVRTDRATGDYVFDITYNPKFHYKSYYRVWVDPQKHYTTKREWYRKDRQLATFYYTEPVNQGGVWLPTHLLVKNVDDNRAGETEYVAMKVNTGLSDDLFKLK